MSTKTNNSEFAFDVKIALRRQAYEQSTGANVLECFGGDGVLWDAVAQSAGHRIKRTRIDKKAGYRGFYLQGDSLSVMKGLPLDRYGIIDLDAYGVPIDHLEHIAASGYRGQIILTCLLTALSKPPKLLLDVNRFPERYHELFGASHSVKLWDLMSGYIADRFGAVDVDVYELPSMQRHGQGGTRGFYARFHTHTPKG